MAFVVGLTHCIVSGCVVGPDYRVPSPAVPENWHAPAGHGLSTGDANVQAWWEVFRDEQLSSLIDRAARGNLDLRIAVLRIREARALRGVAAGALLPSLNGNASYQRSKASANGPGAMPDAPTRGAQFGNTVTRGIATSSLGQGLAAVVPNAAGVTNPLASGLMGLVPTRTGQPETHATDLFASGFDASWEIDVFGGIRRGVEAADADVATAVEDYRAVLVSLMGEVATTYIDVRALQAQIEATQENVELQKQTLVLTQSKFNAQLTSELDVSQARTNLATTESELPALQAELAAAIHRLGVLLGGAPGSLYEELAARRSIPRPVLAASVGVPADVLRRRPDLRAAERRLAAETARIGVAAADLYPRLTLSGTVAFQATHFSHALDGRSVMYGFGPTVRWNIFEGLRTLNRIAAQEAAAHQAYVSYERTLLLALENVETSIVAYQREQVRLGALERATESARQTVHIAKTRYEDGLTDFQNVVDAERLLVTLENASAQSSGQVAVDLVSLYKALGGGWSPDCTPPSTELDRPSDVLTNPLDYWLSGGNKSLPWAGEVDELGNASSPSRGTRATKNEPVTSSD